MAVVLERAAVLHRVSGGSVVEYFAAIADPRQPQLYDRLDALDWAAVPISHQSVETGHGRGEKRTIQVMDAPADLGFPQAAQVFLIERYTTRKVRKRTKGSPVIRS